MIRKRLTMIAGMLLTVCLASTVGGIVLSTLPMFNWFGGVMLLTGVIGSVLLMSLGLTIEGDYITDNLAYGMFFNLKQWRTRDEN